MIWWDVSKTGRGSVKITRDQPFSLQVKTAIQGQTRSQEVLKYSGGGGEGIILLFQSCYYSSSFLHILPAL